MIHLNVKTVPSSVVASDVGQRNTALAWIHKYCESTENKPQCVQGVVYFMDDDNKYDH